MKKILVTGGSGFVGSRLVNLLCEKGYDVTILDKTSNNSNTQKIIKLDLTDYDPKNKSLAKNFDVIFHLAAFIDVNEMIRNPRENTLNNIKSTLNLLEDIRLNNPDCLFIFASSEKVYGNNPFGMLTEKTPVMPAEPYGISKYISELMIINFHINYHLKYIITRAGVIFGPNQNSNSFIPSIIKQIFSGKDVLTLGNLSPYRNFIYIDDVVRAYLLCLTKQNAVNNIFNLSAYNLKISKVLDKIISICYKKLGKKPKIVQDQNLFRISEKKSKRCVLNCNHAKKILNWKPTNTFDESLEKTFNEYLK